jgi:hypothetical protein
MAKPAKNITERRKNNTARRLFRWRKKRQLDKKPDHLRDILGD